MVTGASGFVGRALLPELAQHGYSITAAVRRSSGSPNEVVIGDIGPDTNWNGVLRDIDCVIHLAGRAHVLSDVADNPQNAYRSANTEGTRVLATAAAAAGVKRFVFISSIKVNGERTDNRPFTANDVPSPEDPYGISKLEAERALWKIATDSDMDVCVIRPPLVYGPQVKANFHRLIRLVQRGIPLPFGAVRNRRSLVSVYNLRDLITRCIWHPAAANQIFLVSDGEDLSTADLIRQLSRALGRPARLLPVPTGVLRTGLTIIGRKNEFDRLCGSLQIDITDTCNRLAWQPPVSIDEGLKRTVTE